MIGRMFGAIMSATPGIARDIREMAREFLAAAPLTSTWAWSKRVQK
jgi:hypothetical protein